MGARAVAGIVTRVTESVSEVASLVTGVRFSVCDDQAAGSMVGLVVDVYIVVSVNLLGASMLVHALSLLQDIATLMRRPSGSTVARHLCLSLYLPLNQLFLSQREHLVASMHLAVFNQNDIFRTAKFGSLQRLCLQLFLQRGPRVH